MPRSIEISVSPEKADAIIDRVDRIDGVVGLSRQRGASISPAGDVLLIRTTNDATRPLLELMKELDVLDGGSIVTSEPRSLMSPAHQEVINRESNETVWDEMAFLLRQDTNLAPNYVLLMALAGAIATVGLWTDTLHVVIGSMVIAPAFEPLVQMPFGFIVGQRRLSASGLKSTSVGYVSLAVGALVSVIVLQVIEPGHAAGLQDQRWVQFWSTISGTSIVASSFAAAAGATVISGQRSVLTTGVMIALALIPSMALVGLGVGIGDLDLVGRALMRWIVDVALVVGISSIVLIVKRMYLEHHRALS